MVRQSCLERVRRPGREKNARYEELAAGSRQAAVARCGRENLGQKHYEIGNLNFDILSAFLKFPNHALLPTMIRMIPMILISSRLELVVVVRAAIQRFAR